MPNLPTPIRAALGLAATAVDEARNLPETLPQVVSSVSLRAVSTAMQASLKFQQHLATLSARGDEVLSQLRGSSAEPPTWATFDESPAAPDGQAGEPAKAAFDRIDYDNTGFTDSDPDDTRHRWDAVGVGGTEPDADDLDANGIGTTAPPPVSAAPAPAAKKAAKAAPAKATKAGPAKAAKTAPVKAPAKATKTAAAKAGPAKAKRAARKAEPLEVAASKAQPSGAPTPSTMAAEILHAHEADPGDE